MCKNLLRNQNSYRSHAWSPAVDTESNLSREITILFHNSTYLLQSSSFYFLLLDGTSFLQHGISSLLVSTSTSTCASSESSFTHYLYSSIAQFSSQLIWCHYSSTLTSHIQQRCSLISCLKHCTSYTRIIHFVLYLKRESIYCLQK